MSAYAGTYPGGSFNVSKLFFFAVIVFATIGAVQLCLHARLAHGSEADAVDQCFNDNGTLQTWQLGDKYYQVCDMGIGYGIRVVIRTVDNQFREMTSFIRKTHGKPVTNILDVEKYLTNLGAKVLP